MAFICSKPKGSCKKCNHYKYDHDKGDKACFIIQDIGNKANLTDYKKAIAEGNMELAREIYDIIFR